MHGGGEPGCFAPQRHQSVSLAQQTEPVIESLVRVRISFAGVCWTGFVISLVG